MTDVDALRSAVERLEAAYQIRRERITAEMPGCEPEAVTDESGRPILLDALAAIVNARSALVVASTRRVG